MNNRRRILFTVLTLVTLCVPAFAQGQGNDDDPRASARVHLGPLHLTPTFDVTDLGIDTNIFNAPTNPQPDFTATMQPGVKSAFLVGSRFLAAGTLHGQATYYRVNRDQRALGGDVNETLALQFNRMKLFVDGAYGTRRNRPTYDIDIFVRNKGTQFGGGVDLHVTRRLLLEAAAHRQTTRFDSSTIYLDTHLRDTLDRNAFIGTGGLSFDVTPYTTVGINVEAEEGRYPFAPERDNDTMVGSATVSFSPRAVVSGNAGVGIRVFRPYWKQSSTLPPFTGPVAHGSLSYRLRESTQLTFSLARDVLSSFELKQPYSIGTDGRLSLRRHLFGRYDATAMGRLAHYDYRYFNDLTQLFVPRRDTVISYGLALGTRLTRGSRLETGATYTQRESTTQAIRFYKGWRIMTSFTRGI